MTQVLERPLTTVYAPPALEPLGTLRSLTKGLGPGGEPMVMQSVITFAAEVPGRPDRDAR